MKRPEDIGSESTGRRWRGPGLKEGSGAMATGSEPILLRIPEAALVLRLGESTVKGMVHRGELPVVRCGRAVRVPRRELEEWVAQRTEHANGWLPEWLGRTA